MEFESNYASELFDQFLSANTMRVVLSQFKRICNFLAIEPGQTFNTFYPRLKQGIVNNWKAKSIFNKIDKKASNKVYSSQNKNHEILRGQKCLVIGGGPCGLRTAIELQLMGADHVLIVEKRDRISRNNVIHLWPFVIHDLKELAGKKLNAKFCSGSIDHVSIRQLQLMLLKVALILGCDFVDNVEFESICPHSIQQNVSLSQKNTQCCCSDSSHVSFFRDNCAQEDDSSKNIGAYAHFKYNANSNYPNIVEKLDNYAFNILIGADGRRNLLSDYFPRKQFRGRLAIAITANFINNHSLAEAQVAEISGISYIYYQQLFKSLNEQTNIDLENICYYKDDTHYFVMTTKKASLLARGVLIQDFNDTRALLAPENVNQASLLAYAKDAARWTTGLENLKFAVNHYGNADVGVFDFSTMSCSENACRVKKIYSRTRCNKHNSASVNVPESGQLLLSLVGDSLLEPFWPTGSGCGRGFLSSMDAAWFCRQFAVKCLSNGEHNDCLSSTSEDERILSVISERESIYRLLAQTKSENLNQNFNHYTINPISRYPNLNSFTITPNQCKHLLYSNVRKSIQSKQSLSEKRARRITIAITPNSCKQSQEVGIKILDPEPQIDQILLDHNSQIAPVKMSGNDFLTHSKQFMTPSAFNLATIEKSRHKEIENVIKQRKQREEKISESCTAQISMSSEERFMNHLRKQVKPKADWFLLNSKTVDSNSYESTTSSNRSTDNNSSQEDDPPVSMQHFTRFSNKVRDLEFKLNSHNSFNEERFLSRGCENEITNRNMNSVNLMAARLSLIEDLLDPIKREAKFKEEVKRKAFLAKDCKFVGKLTKNDWNVRKFNGADQNSQKDVESKSNKPRPKERIAIFKEKLHNIENILTNGGSSKNLSDEVNQLSKKQLQKFETRSGSRCGQWIEKLKSELSDKQQSSNSLNKHKKFDYLSNKISHSQGKLNKEVEEDSLINFTNTRRNVEYIKYEKLNKPTITQLKQNTRTNIKQDRNRDKPFQQQIGVFDHQQMIAFAKETCARCSGKVMTIDKLNINGVLFHRHCLKCKICGSNLRLSELRHTNNVIDQQNCICTLCSNENRLLTRSNSTNSASPSSSYSSRLKERMRWKESFLLNQLSDQASPSLESAQDEQRKEINERVEYENTSITDELLDDEEVTRLVLNLGNKNHHENNNSKSSKSFDMHAKTLHINQLSSNSKQCAQDDDPSTSYLEGETFNSTMSSDDESTSSSDTTGCDINSDQFDSSEVESPKIAKNLSTDQNLPEIIVVDHHDDDNDDDDDDGDEKTLNETVDQHESSNNASTICDAHHILTKQANTEFSTIPETSKTTSHISDLSEVDEFDLTATREHEHPLVSIFSSNFKVELPSSVFFNRPTAQRQKNIECLTDESTAINTVDLAHNRPSYNGSFTEKVMKSRSSPCLND